LVIFLLYYYLARPVPIFNLAASFSLAMFGSSLGPNNILVERGCYWDGRRAILMGNQGFMLGLAEERLPIFNFAADMEPHCHDQGIQHETGEPPIPSSFCNAVLHVQPTRKWEQSILTDEDDDGLA
jgi:hypothetical protein